MKIVSVLTSMGLHEVAAQIYLAALSLGTSSVQDLAKQVGIKRTAAYFHIDELMKDGLLEKIPIGKKDYYRATDPSVLQKRAEQQLVALKDSLPKLVQKKEHASGRPRISILEGEKGIRNIYEESMNHKEIRFWSSLDVFESKFQDLFHKYGEMFQKSNIIIRELISDNPDTIKAAKRLMRESGKNYKVYVTKEGNLYNDSLIYGDVIVLIRIQDFNLYAVRIEDKSMAETMRTLYDTALAAAAELKIK